MNVILFTKMPLLRECVCVNESQNVKSYLSTKCYLLRASKITKMYYENSTYLSTGHTISNPPVIKHVLLFDKEFLYKIFQTLTIQ